MAFSITELLERYRAMVPQDRVVLQRAAEAASTILGISIDPGLVRIQNGVVYFDVPPSARSELILHRSEFLISLEKSGCGRTVTDLR